MSPEVVVRPEGAIIDCGSMKIGQNEPSIPHGHPQGHAIFREQEEPSRGLWAKPGCRFEVGSANEARQHDRRSKRCESGAHANSRAGAKWKELIARASCRILRRKAIGIEEIGVVPILAMPVYRIDRNYSDGAGGDSHPLYFDVIQNVAPDHGCCRIKP